MAAIQQAGSPGLISIRSSFLIGRSGSCDLQVNDPRISREHAGIWWTSAQWEVRDLGSKNGTYVNRRRLSSGERASLRACDTFSLGEAEPTAPTFTLVDDTPPNASAWNSRTGLTRAAEAGIIALPDDRAPAASLVEHHDGRWALETDGCVQYVTNRQTITVNGDPWHLDLPQRSSPTLPQSSALLCPDTTLELRQISLRFLVSRDEERVDIVVLRPGGATELSSRSHHYLLLTLARIRLAPAGNPATMHGWVERDDLCRMLATDELRLNVDVFRARKQFAALGIQDAAGIIDRKMGTGRVRLGVEQVEVLRQ